MNLVSTLGIDLAKSAFSLHGVNSNGATHALAGEAQRTCGAVSPCLIGMEGCSGAHEWARRFAASLHTVKLMAAKFVMPYRKSRKNDGNDAEAICEAVARPNRRFVLVKCPEQQSDLSLHRVRQGFVRLWFRHTLVPARSPAVRRLSDRFAPLVLPDRSQ